jgi:cobalt-zinc-cadmium efflux system membrane fusion protein
MTPRSALLLSNRRWLLAGAALLAAGGAGFGIAKLTDRPPAAAPAANETAKAAPDTVQLDAARIAASDIGVQTVSVGGLASEILAQATVAAEPGGQASLSAHAAGSVARINKRLGDPVRAGEVVALVESREAAQIAASRSAAAAKADLAAKVFARERRLYEQKVSPRQDMETAQAELAAAQAEARSATVSAGAAQVSRDGRFVQVVSPISGRITSMSAALGAFVQPETELFRIADPGRIQVEAQVTAADAERVRPGDAAVIETANGDTRNAVVRSVTPGVSAETRAATVVLTLAGGGANLQPGQTARVRILAGRGAGGAIVIPQDAIQSLEGRDVVFVRTPKGFRARPVMVGQRSAGRAEIAAGLKPGEAIAVRNAFLLKAELGKGSEDEE